MRNKATFNRQLLLNPGRRVVGASCFGSAEEVVVEEEDGEEDGKEMARVSMSRREGSIVLCVM